MLLMLSVMYWIPGPFSLIGLSLLHDHVTQCGGENPSLHGTICEINAINADRTSGTKRLQNVQEGSVSARRASNPWWKKRVRGSNIGACCSRLTDALI